jgi:3-phosphoshikimate 1-carboxyvinyltransferase
VAFLDALQLIGGEVQVKGLQAESLQGDAIYQAYFKQLKETAPVLDISECPDLGPILMGMAAANHGARFTGTRRLKLKESDRGAVMGQELAKFGIQVDVFENEIVVHPGILQAPTEILDSHNDHRIAMTMAVLCTLTGGTITCAEAVKKSFPTFYEVLESLGIETRRECE